MKKILLSLIAATGLIATSCDMDLKPQGELLDQNAITDITTARNFRNGIYSSMRSIMVGDWVYMSDIQMDQFVMLTSPQGLSYTIYGGQIEPSNSIVDGLYSGPYSRMKNVNFFIEKVGDIMKNLTEAEQEEAEYYIAEAKFARAYYYWFLLDHFCQAYDPAKADQEGLGLSLVTKYNPTGVVSSYPGRSSWNKTLALINQDLEDAAATMKPYASTAAPNDIEVNYYTVLALQARLALVTKDYETAFTKAQEVINSGIYTLAEGDDYETMWSKDQSTELLFVPFCNANEASGIGSMCEGWNYWANSPDQVQMLPAANVVASYDQANDIRYKAFFTPNYAFVKNGTTYQATVFSKYPGNTSLDASRPEYKNRPKPFRLSELYLIAAEAGIKDHVADASQYINDLRAKRITGWSATTYTAANLLKEVKIERAKELIGEGFRMSDLRRWGEGFTRDASYPNAEVESIFYLSGKGLTYAPNDYRYVLPIPTSEMKINPQLKGQQNPGY